MTMTQAFKQFVSREFHSIDEVAAFTGISRGTTYKAFNAGELKGKRYGRKIRVRTVDALTWAGIDPAELTPSEGQDAEGQE